MKVPAVLQRTLDSAVSVGSRIARRKENRNDDEAHDDDDEVTDSTLTTRQVFMHVGRVARKQTHTSKGHQTK